MHVGRTYPYLFEFWVGNFWFFPEWAGRQIRFQSSPGGVGDFAPLAAAGVIVSAVGVPAGDFASSRWDLGPVAGYDAVTLTARNTGTDPGSPGILELYCRLASGAEGTVYSALNFNQTLDDAFRVMGSGTYTGGFTPPTFGFIAAYTKWKGWP